MSSPQGDTVAPRPVADANDHDERRHSGALTADDVHWQIPERLDSVDTQLHSLSNRPHKPRSGSVSSSGCEKSRSTSTFENEEQKRQGTWPLTVSADVSMCNFQQFKTAVDAGDTVAAIDALVWTPTLSDDIKNFMASLKRPPMRRDQHMERSKRIDVSDAEALNAFPPNETWIQQIRVNSQAVLSVLDRFSYNAGPLVKEPHIFRRPFLYFIHNYRKIHEELQKIESRRRTGATPANQSAIFQEIGQSPDTLDKCSETQSSTPEVSLKDESRNCEVDRAAAELRCFCDFIRKYVMPKYEALQNDAFAKRQKIHYDDLDFIFKPGELIYMPANQPDESRISTGRRQSAGQQTIFRLQYLSTPTRMGGPVTERVPRPFRRTEIYRPTEDNSVDDEYLERLSPGYDRIVETRRVSYYYIEFDGERYASRNAEQSAIIPVFWQPCHITELPVYPARFMDNYEDALKEAKEHGEKMVDLLSGSPTHAHYSGWTLTTGPMGTRIEDPKGNLVRFPERIESDIIVDYSETFKHIPSWTPVRYFESETDKQLISTPDPIPSVRLSPYPPYELVAKYDDRLVYLDPMQYRQWHEYMITDVYDDHGSSRPPVLPEDLALLPRRLFAYSLWDRKFIQIDSKFANRRVRKGQEGQSFQQLQIEQRSKDVIESLLFNHFNDMKAERAGVVIESQDLIRGKGRGVSILLHGKPGVGKTATAEAVAEKWNRPPFPITCGDLGYHAETVETRLDEIFHLAHLWGCILLLDEADIFITQRTNQELQRNGLVSVFLRMLEYYNGILFLTTNRTGVLDEAIKSRIHLHLGFDDLNEHQTIEIFKNNIGRLRTRDQQRTDAMPGHRALQIDVDGILKFAENHYRSCNAMGRWNGRQIRNAFVVASSLANFEAEKRSPDWQPQLRAEHFHTVLESTMQYDRYRQSVFTMSDDALAFSRMERAEPTAPPAPSATYGFAQNGSPFSAQQFSAQQPQQAGGFTGTHYGGATGAVFAHAGMQNPSTSSFPYNASFAPGTRIPGPAQAGLYHGQPAYGQDQPVPSTLPQGQMYSQPHGQPGFATAASGQSHGGAQEQGPINAGGSSNLRTGAVEPMYTSGATAAPGGWGSTQGQAQPPNSQHGSVEGARGGASGDGFQGIS